MSDKYRLVANPADFPVALVRWRMWRKRLRRWGWPVPMFMTPWLGVSSTTNEG